MVARAWRCVRGGEIDERRVGGVGGHVDGKAAACKKRHSVRSSCKVPALVVGAANGAMLAMLDRPTCKCGSDYEREANHRNTQKSKTSGFSKFQQLGQTRFCFIYYTYYSGQNVKKK